MSRGRFCVVCRETRQEPVTCAPGRCYCGHRECPAFASYIPVREAAPALVTPTKPTSTVWADRDSPTWIDNL